MEPMQILAKLKNGGWCFSLRWENQEYHLVAWRHGDSLSPVPRAKGDTMRDAFDNFMTEFNEVAE